MSQEPTDPPSTPAPVLTGTEPESSTMSALTPSADPVEPKSTGTAETTESTETTTTGITETPAPPKLSILTSSSSSTPALTPAPAPALGTGPGPTPAPASTSSLDPPGAPARAPPKTLPAIDVTEFDPFATPSVPLSGSSGSVGANGSSAGPRAVSGNASSKILETPMPPSKVGASSTLVPGDVMTPIPRPAPSASALAQAQSGSGEATPSGTTSNQPSRAMTPAEAGASGKVEDPAFNFSGFLKDLRTKSADSVARYLKSFLNNFAKKPFTVNEQIKLIRDFLGFIEEKMRLVEPWKSQTPAELDNALEAMEKLVMNRLYPYTFTPQLVPSQPITTDDLERDGVFAQRVRLFNWVREKHLDVPESEAAQGFLGFAEQELLKINHYKAPRDKMICILNCCKVIFGLIRHTQGAEATSADAFVPILIFVVLRANPDNLPSNVEYISRFRSPEKLQGEAGYYLSSLTGAIAFIETMDASSLSNITQSEFETNVEKAIQDLPLSPTVRSSRLQSTAASFPTPTTPRGGSSSASGPGSASAGEGNDTMSPFGATAPGEEAARPLRMMPSPSLVVNLDGTRRFFARTGTFAQEAVSRPISAIGKILEGIQQSGDESVSGSEDEGYSGPGAGRSGAGASGVAGVTGSGGGAGHTSGGGAGAGGGGSARRSRRSRRAVTPESPSRRFAQLGISPDSRSIPGTPLYEPIAPPDFSQSEIQQATDSSNTTFDQARYVNVQTLHQMFPALEEEIVEAVLVGCGDDLGVAIDRLLEM